MEPGSSLSQNSLEESKPTAIEPGSSLSQNSLEDTVSVKINPQLVQIKASSEDEVKRRIAAFMWNKRSEIDERNIREFICPLSSDHGDIFSRIKALEKRISILEGLSLEYFSNGIPKDVQRGQSTENKQGRERDPLQKPPESLEFINSRILLLKESLKQKTNEIKRQCQN